MSISGTVLLLLAMQSAPLEGVVFKKGANEPLSKATVELRRETENAGIVGKLTTEEDGRFFFENVPPGRYRITVTRRGYVRPPLSITVAANQPRAEVLLPMTAAGVISGRVDDANSQPLGNVEVLAMKASYPEGRRMLTPVRSATTNDLGEYRLFWLPPGRYYVSAIHPKAQNMLRRMTGVFGMSITGGSAVSVFQASGKSDPVFGGFEPEPESESERYAPVFFGGTTDELLAASIDIRTGAEVSGANIMIAPVRPRHVRGIVIDGITGRPAQYASLTLAKEDAAPRSREPRVDRETGMFDIVLLPGVHTLDATSASGEGWVTFRLGDADIENLVITTTPAFDIPGRIRVEGEPNAGSALGSLQITLRHDPPRDQPRTSSLSYSTPLPDGSFTVSAPAGDYRMNIAPLLNLTAPLAPRPLPAGLQNAYVKSIRLGNIDILNAPLHLERKPSVPLEVVIAKNAGMIEGQVVMNRQGSPADMTVVIVPDVRRRSELYRTTTTDAAGRFHFDRVPPGDYKLFSWEEVQEGAWFDPDFMRASENLGTAVRVAEGRTERVRVEAIP